MTFSVIDTVPVGAGARVYEEGWQSWSPTGWYALDEAPTRPTLDWQHLMRFRPGTPIAPTGFQGEGLLLVEPGGGAPVRVYEAQTALGEIPTIRAEVRAGKVVVSADGPVRVSSVPAEAGVARTAGGARAAGVAGARGAAEAALAGVGERIAAEVLAARGAGPLRPAPTAWCSWYRYFLDVTEADIVENLAAISQANLPVDVIQIDDGWQAGVGDWTTLSGRFTSMERLAGTIQDAGFQAGIWLAPFTVGSGSELAREHPDWLVGEAGTNWDQSLHGLDLTHPDAREYLWGALRTLADAGYSYFKLDFLYSGAVPGVRRDCCVSPTDAYRSGLELVRDAVGTQAYLLGCGAPLLPSVGLVDAMRVSADTFHPEGQDGSTGLRGARAVTARSWQHGRLWTNDADCFVGRPSFALREDWAHVIETYGGLRSASDRISELDDWGLAATRALLATAPGPVPFEHPEGA